MSAANLHAHLVACLVEEWSNEDALAAMLVLHTQKIAFAQPPTSDRPTVSYFSAITRRHAAEAIAQCWPDRSDLDRTNPVYWYFLSSTETPYEISDDFSADWAARVDKMKRRLIGQMGVIKVEDED